MSNEENKPEAGAPRTPVTIKLHYSLNYGDVEINVRKRMQSVVGEEYIDLHQLLQSLADEAAGHVDAMIQNQA